MEQEYPYIKTINSAFSRPVLPIQLHHHERIVRAEALVDSGASISILPYEVGQALGLNWETSAQGVEIKGRVRAENSRKILVGLEVAPFESFLNLFLWVKDSEIPLVLGQINFFAHFDIRFSASKQIFSLQLANQ
jgi:hypothetical protein